MMEQSNSTNMNPISESKNETIGPIELNSRWYYNQ